MSCVFYSLINTPTPTMVATGNYFHISICALLIVVRDYSMSDICCCIDLDGFRVQGTFVTRELGLCDREAKRVGCFHYTHAVKYSSLTDKDKRTVQYVKDSVSGLPFYPGRRERSLGVHSQDQVKEDIVSFWNKCQSPHAFTVAYKGGTLEKTILDQLRIPSVNLEDFGCPKYEYCNAPHFDCGCHKNSYFHCSVGECYAFITWFNKTQTT